VGATVDAVDHGIGRALQLVIEAALDQPADDRNIEAFAGQHVAARAALDAAFGERAVHALDDVAALAELAQRHLGLIVDHPLAGSDFTGEAEGCSLRRRPTFSTA
jgi:hypothetical protein